MLKPSTVVVALTPALAAIVGSNDAVVMASREREMAVAVAAGMRVRIIGRWVVETVAWIIGLERGVERGAVRRERVVFTGEIVR